MSLKENLLVREPQEEVVVDFRVEIERRFMKSGHNQTFKFPLKQCDDDSGDESMLSSMNSSFESLKHVTVYDLSSQNNKRKVNQIKQAFKEERQVPKSASNHGRREMDLDVSDDSVQWDEEERSGVPIELRIRDKSTATYRKLLQLIEQQLNPSEEIKQQNNLVRAQIAKKQQINQEQTAKAPVQPQQFGRDNVNDNYSSNINTVEDEQDVEVHRLDQSKAKKERNIKSQGRQEKATYYLADFQRQTKAVGHVQGAKKNLSQDRVASRIETNPSGGSSTIEKTMSHLNVSSTKGDSSKTTQDHFKKMYNSSILKSITPQYNNSSQITNLKENVLKTYAQDNYQSTTSTKTTMDSLYQKARNEVLSHKVKSTAVNPARYQVKNANNSMSATKRDETPKDVARKVNFNNFYGSPDMNLDKSSSRVLSHTSQNNLTKKESVKAFQVASPYKKTNESAQMYSSYDFSSQSKIAKRPDFKLDLNKRTQAYRDALSSTRNRKKRTPDRVSDVLNTESGIRNSYDMQQYNSVLNSSSQKNTSKKPIGFTPSSTAKNLSFTKTFFSYK